MTMQYDFSKYTNAQLDDFALEIDLCDNPQALQEAFDSQSDGSEMIGDFSVAAGDELKARQSQSELKNEDPAETLRVQLNVASRARQQFGASQAQINYIVSLAIELDDYNVLGNSHTLTKGEASAIIASMKAQADA